MAANVGNSVETIVFSSHESSDAFRAIWPIASLRIAKSEHGFWLKGFTKEDLKLPSFLAMGHIQIFDFKDPFLFLPGNQVPERKLPSGLLWHPIQTALKIKLPSFNENLFQVPGQLDLEFQSSIVERDATASLVSRSDLLKYVDSTAQHVYTKNLWCLFGEEMALVIGSEVLPLVSQRFWSYKNLLLPVGFDFNYDFLKDIVVDLQTKGQGNLFWLFESNGRLIEVDKEALVFLTRSSVKMTLQAC